MGVYVVAAVLLLLSLAVVEAENIAGRGRRRGGRRPARPGAAALHAQEAFSYPRGVHGRAGRGGRARAVRPRAFSPARSAAWAAIAPQLQLILAYALDEGGWFGEAHESQLREALSRPPDPGERGSGGYARCSPRRRASG